MERLRNLDVGALILGLIILGIGVYYFLQRTLGLSMPDLDWDKVWPLLVIALGVGMLYSAWARMGKGAPSSKTPEHALATYRVPIEGRDEWIAASKGSA